MDVKRKLFENFCGFAQTGVQHDFLRSNKKAVHLIYTSARTFCRILMASDLR